jgi:hypothetical protein
MIAVELLVTEVMLGFLRIHLVGQKGRRDTPSGVVKLLKQTSLFDDPREKARKD